MSLMMGLWDRIELDIMIDVKGTVVRCRRYALC